MAQSTASLYTGATTGGFWTGLIGGLGDLLKSPMYRALPTQPNPQSQILVSRNSSFVSDPGAPATPFHPAGYAMADLWYNPLDPVTVEHRYQDNYVWDNVRGKFVNQPIANFQTSPKFYSVKSASADATQDALAGKITTQYENLFRAPEAAAVNADPCSPTQAEVAATASDRINRLTMNQFFSPFRARRTGGNSYQALSESVDDIFDPSGKAGVFTDNGVPDFVQSAKTLRLPRK